MFDTQPHNCIFVLFKCFSTVLDSTFALSLSLGVDVLAAIEIAVLAFKEKGMKHKGKLILLCVVVVCVLLGQGWDATRHSTPHVKDL
jgi:hypothetical protein